MFRVLLTLPSMLIEEAAVAAEELDVGYEHGWTDAVNDMDRAMRDARKFMLEIEKERQAWYESLGDGMNHHWYFVNE